MRMNGMDILLRIRAIRLEIPRRRQRAESLRRMASQITPLLREVRVTSSPDPTRMQAVLAEAADEEAELLRLQQELADLLPEGVLAVSSLPDSRLSRIMELYYLNGMPLPAIASMLHLSLGYACKLRRRAVAALGGEEHSRPLLFPLDAGPIPSIIQGR